MISLLQRVKQAKVEVDDKNIGEIDQGLLILVGFEPNDSEADLEKMFNRIINYRIFADADDKMNLSLKDVRGSLLIVPQFTLAADTAKGRRPSFTRAANPDLGNYLYDLFVSMAKQTKINIQTGRFGADMQVHLQNDGPATFILK